ncbi:MAG: hypothetical protein IKS51_03855 [Erysipelotrichaceae bacterium]|nr:hypothetical protein [Erysipelotrichaceae bacterium]
MKNKKKTRIIVAALLLAVCAFAGYFVLAFAKEKYHFIRDHLNDISETVSKMEEDIDKIEEEVSFVSDEQFIHYDFDYSWTENNVLVAHAMGGYEGQIYTNSLQAFEYNYDLGYRVFEVDFDLSTDYYLICCHDEDRWREFSESGDDIEYDLEHFKSRPICGDMSTLDGKDIIDLLIEYPDIYIITDNKYKDEYRVRMQFLQLLRYAEESGHPEVLDRVIPQIYHEKMLNYLMDLYDFKSMIYTIYKDPDWQTDTLAVFCSKTGIGFVTMWGKYATKERLDAWDKFGIMTATHTIDDREEAQGMLDLGVTMIYTNSLLPEDFER